ncbi:hypothetical protein RB614_16265 [Phytohabitans sp. ZYX-F-186]|uniref:ABC3 transporter permease protein domain-containing protein n=1 Tax=Phytohabitans maris TaxID=3071409 RepID=A0ABU0ZGE7_9ACTN|nr:hypothetical protein [Phytohabitans sp. ZYX-F-186]MDQ7906068.1 hypothetical protein [Phytohabitans sp. ZYX-F-186]
MAFLRHAVAQVSALALMGFVLAGSVVGLATVRDSAQQAILDSVRADLGQRSYALQTGDPAASRAVSTVDGPTPVQDQMGDVMVDGLSVPVLVRSTTSASLKLGVVTRGAWPERVGEVILSESTARSLGIALGDTVSIRADGGETPGRVVGLTVDPANRTTSTLVRLVYDSSEFRPTMWLSDSDFYAAPPLKPVLDSRSATYQSLQTLLEAAADNRPHFLSAMRFVPAGCGLLAGVLLVSVGTVFSRRWRTYADALVAAGMAPAVAWRRILSVAFGTVLVGEIIGGIVAAVALWLSRGPVSAWVGQHWVRISFPWQESAVVLGLTIVVALVAAPVVGLAREWTRRLTPRPARRGWVTPAAVLAAVVGLAGWLVMTRVSLQQSGDWATTFAKLAAALIAVAAPFLIAPVLGVGLRTATRPLMRHLVAALRPIAAAGALVAIATSMWSAQTTRDANLGEAMSSPLQPAGSFVISEMPDTAIPALIALYRSHGGDEVIQFRIPDEATTQLRATGPEVVSCMSDRGITEPVRVVDCFPQDSESPINRVLIGQPGSTPRADPELLDSGRVGLLLFHSGEGTAARLAGTDAEADPALGGNLPGLVVPADGEVAKQFGLTSKGTSEVVLRDFHRLSSHDQFLMRAAAIRLAPSAETASGTDPTAYDRLRSLANTVGFLGATATMVIVLVGGLSLVVAHTLSRRTLVDTGAVPAVRWGIVARWTAIPTLTTALTVPLAILTVSSGGQSTDASYGLLWTLPGALGALASLIIGIAFLRTPTSAGE